MNVPTPFLLALGLLVAVGSIIRVRLSIRRLTDGWSRLAGQLGVELRRGSGVRNLMIVGELGTKGGLKLTIDLVSRTWGPFNRLDTRICVHSSSIPIGLSIRGADEPKISGDVLKLGRLGDGSGWFVFEVRKPRHSLVYATSPDEIEAAAMAVLTETARGRIVGLIERQAATERGLALSHGALTLVVHALVRDPTRLARWVQELRDIARLLSLEPSQTATGLLQNAHDEPDSELRFRSLELLLRVHRDTDEARTGAERALTDALPWNRLLGALFLGRPECGSALVEADRTPLFEHLRTRAVRHIREVAAVEGVLDALLSSLMDIESADLKAAVVAACGEHGHLQAVPTLRQAIAAADWTVGLEIATALRKLGCAESELGLIDLLRTGNERVVLAAIDGLMEVGTVGAVPALLEIAEDKYRLRRARHAARVAVARIQSQLDGAEAGALSLVELSGAQGALSLADEGGSLSLVQQSRRATSAAADEGAVEAVEEATETVGS